MIPILSYIYFSILRRATSRIEQWGKELLKQGLRISEVRLLFTAEDCVSLNMEEKEPPQVAVIGYRTLQLNKAEATVELKTFECAK